jgi:tetratricopeptide (TPR) repeat protein
MGRGRRTEALQAFDRSRAIREKLAAANPTVTQFQTDLAEILNNIGVIQRLSSQRAEALQSFQKALVIREKLVALNPTVTSYQSQMATNLGNIAAIQRETGEPAKALESYQRALAVREHIVDANPTLLRTVADVAKSYHDIGRLQMQTGNPGAAREAFDRAAATWAKVPNPHPTDHYSIACIHALQSALTGETNADRQKHAALAVASLNKALAAGFRGLSNLAHDSDLDSLRTRDDFKLLMMDLAMPTDPFAAAR